MEAKEALDGPALWEDACITDDEPIIVYANLDRSARGVMLVLSEAPRYEKPPGKPAGRGLF